MADANDSTPNGGGGTPSGDNSTPNWWDTWWKNNGKTVGKAAGAFGLGYAPVAARNKAQGERNVLGYEAQVAGNNAAIAGYQAGIAQQVGERNEQSSMLHTANVFSTQRANMAAGGIDLGQGSATEVLASTEYMGQREAAAIHDDTARQVWALNNQKAQFLAEQQAKLAQSNAINPDMAAFGSFLGSAGSYAKDWYNSK